MSGYNRIEVIGNIGRDPELRYTAQGQAVLGFSLAVTERWKNSATGEMQESTQWYDISIWGNRAEGLAPHLEKGQQLHVGGTPSVDAYIDRNGEAQGKIKINARDITFMRKPQAGDGQPRVDTQAEEEDVTDIPF